MNKSSRVVTDPKVLFGKPRIAGTRISVEQILACLAQGWTERKIITEFDGLTVADIHAAVDYSRNLLERTRAIRLPTKKTLTNA